MTKLTLNLEAGDVLGRAFRIDTASVWAEATDHERLTRISVGSLIALQGASAAEYLIGVLDRVTRDMQEEALIAEMTDEGQIPVRASQKDFFRVILLGTYRKVSGDRHDIFKRGADSYPQVDAACWVVDGSNLQSLMGLLAQQVSPDQQLKLGHFVADPSAAAVADGDRLFQRHAALLGSTGSGKSWAVALILERAKALKHPNLVVFDMHGEYSPLSEGADPVGRGLKIAGPSDGGKTDDSTLYLPWWLLNQEEMQALLLDRSEENAPNQAARLTHHVRELKAQQLDMDGHTELIDKFTVDSPLPFDLRKLIDRLNSDDTEMVPGSTGRDKQGPFFGRLSRFVARLESRTADRRYSFMFAPPLDEVGYEWLTDFAIKLLGTNPGIKIIDFSEVPSDVLPIVVGVLARILYEIHFWTDAAARTPITLVCDEAHLYLPAHDANVGDLRALDAFERIAKEGRKYGVSLLVVSQRPSDVSRTVLSQCNNFIVLRLTNDRDQQVVSRLIPDSMASLTASLPLLDVGEALLLGDAIILPTRLRFDSPKVKPNSATMNFWSDWNSAEVDDDAIAAAVEAMRRQTRHPGV